MTRISIKELKVAIERLEKTVSELEVCNNTKRSAQKAYAILIELNTALFSPEFAKALQDERNRLLSLIWKD